MPVGSESSKHLSVSVRKNFFLRYVLLFVLFCAMDAQRKLNSSKDYFHLFDKDNKEYLNKDEFCELIKYVVKVDGSSCEELEWSDLFLRFDSNNDNKIDAGEFEIVWRCWFKPLMEPVTALIIVDVQNDFIDGSLAMRKCPAKQEGKEVVPVINELTESIDFDVVVYSIDYHPENHISFFENINLYNLSDKNSKKNEDIKPFDVVTFAGPPEMNQTLWPKHCVQGSWGGELHPELKVVENPVFIHKGANPKVDSYSAFFDNSKSSSTKLHAELQQRQVTHVFVTGLAYDYCVAFTALDALELGYATVLIEDAARGTDVDNIQYMKEKLISNLCVIAKSDEVKSIASGKDTRIEFAKVLGNHK